MNWIEDFIFKSAVLEFFKTFLGRERGGGFSTCRGVQVIFFMSTGFNKILSQSFTHSTLFNIHCFINDQIRLLLNPYPAI